MVATRTLVVLLFVGVALATPPHVRRRRQLADDNTLQPIEDAEGDEQTREKRKFEGVSQAKFGIKNAVLGYVFGSGTTSRRHPRDTNTGSPTKLSLIGPTGPAQPRQSTTPDRPSRQAPKEDDIPEFDRNKVSLDFPGNLFGPSVSLLLRSTKIIGDVIQNSAVRYQSFLRLFRGLFRGPFEIKGLDPPTTTTTTTTTTTRAPKSADNEVRR